MITLYLGLGFGQYPAPIFALTNEGLVINCNLCIQLMFALLIHRAPYPHSTVTLFLPPHSLTTQEKTTISFFMTALAIGSVAITVKIAPKKLFFYKLNNYGSRKVF